MSSRQSHRQSTWERILNISRHEAPEVIYSWCLKFFYHTGHVIGHAVILSMFAQRIGVEYLPVMFIVSAGFMILGTTIFANILDQGRKDRLIMLLALGGAVLLVVSRWLSDAVDPIVFFGVLLATYSIILAQLTIITALFIEQKYTPLEAQRVFPVIESADLIGGVAGGAAVSLLVGEHGILSTEDLLYVWAGLVAVVMLCVVIFNFWTRNSVRIEAAEEEEEGEKLPPLQAAMSSLQHIRQMPFLKSLALMIFLQYTLFQLLEFQYTKALAHGSHGEDHLTHGLGMYTLVVSGIGVILQIFLAERIAKVLGVVRSIALNPILSLVSFIPMLFSFTAVTAIGAKGVFDLTNIISKNAYLTSYYAVKEEVREHCKQLIEGFILPLGIILGTLILFAVQMLSGGIGHTEEAVESHGEEHAYFSLVETAYAAHHGETHEVVDDHASVEHGEMDSHEDEHGADEHTSDGHAVAHGAVDGHGHGEHHESPALFSYKYEGVEVIRIDSYETWLVSLMCLVVALIMMVVARRMKERYTKTAVKGLKSRHYMEKWGAIEILGQQGHNQAGFELMKALKLCKNDDEMTKKVMLTLAQARELASIPAILDYFDHENKEVRLVAIQVLTKFEGLGDKFFFQAFSRYRIMESLKRMFESESSNTLKKEIINAFSSLNQLEMVPFLLEVLQKTDDPEVRSATIAVIGHFRDPNIYHYLKKYLEDPDPYVRSNTIVALWQFKQYRLELLGSTVKMLSGTQRDEVRAMLYMLGMNKARQEEKKVRTFLDHEDPEVRMYAAWALAKMGRPDAIGLLSETVMGDDQALSRRTVKMIAQLGQYAYELVYRDLKQLVSHEIRELLAPVGHNPSKLKRKELERLSYLYSLIGEDKQRLVVDQLLNGS